MVILFIVVMLALIRLGWFIYKTFAISFVKLFTFAIDYVIILMATVEYFNPQVTAKYVTESWVHIMGALACLVFMALYTILIKLFNEKLPVLSKIFNLFVVFVGVTVAVPFALEMLTPIISIFDPKFEFDGDVIIFTNQTLNFIFVNALYALICVPAWKYRMGVLDGR